MRLDPPPSSWAVLKPTVLPLLRKLASEGAGPLALEGYPLCALSSQERGLFARQPGSPFGQFEACWKCGLRDQCNPPVEWSDELEPFGPCDPMALWLRFHRHACDRLGIARAPVLDDLVELAVGACVGARRVEDLTLEPSILVDQGRLIATIRLAMFHGEPPRDLSKPVQHGILETLYAMQRRIGCSPAQWLGEALARLAQVDVFLGFDARPGQPILLKAYLTTRHLTIDARRSLAECLVREAGGEVPGWWSEVDWSVTEMIGLGWRDGRLANVKLYVARNPGIAWAGPGLEALPPDHPGILLSGGVAYAVIDAYPGSSRSPKWDCRVRDHLLTGRRLAQAFSEVLGDAGRAAISAFMRDCPVRTDTANVGFRGTQVAFYAWLG